MVVERTCLSLAVLGLETSTITGAAICGGRHDASADLWGT